MSLRNLNINLGNDDSDSVFLRSFSSLILASIVENDIKSKTLNEILTMKFLMQRFFIMKKSKILEVIYTIKDGRIVLHMGRI